MVRRFLPIVVVMCLQGILRQYISVLLRDDRKMTAQAAKDFQATQQLRRAARFRANSSYIPAAAYRMRKAYFITRAFRDRPKSENEENPNDPMAAMQQDPSSMVGPMKQQMAMIIPQMALMGWVSYLFSGFVLAKLPFGLTERFKSMLQRGVVLQSLDVSYVSSLSWYFLTLFGLRGLFDLILGGDNDANSDAKLMQAQMAGGGMGGPQALDTTKLFAAERTEVEILPHDFVIASAEHRLVLAK
jgi:hypothetical protein